MNRRQIKTGITRLCERALAGPRFEGVGAETAWTIDVKELAPNKLRVRVTAPSGVVRWTYRVTVEQVKA